jgi:ABC-type branched-subunit amino acid transport system ATPase component
MSVGAGAILTVAGVSKHFDGIVAVDGVDLSIERGRITALIGPNGAGKTTLFNILAGLLSANAGNIFLNGENVTALRPYALYERGVVRTFQISRGFPSFTVFEHLMAYGRRQGGERIGSALLRDRSVRQRERELTEQAEAIAERLNLTQVIDLPVTQLSGGQKKLLEIGRALMAEPTLLLFDEPAAGVNPALTAEIAEHLRQIAKGGTTILLVEHDMGLIEDVSDHVIVMALGRKLAEGTFERIRENEDVQLAYLGVRQ